MYIELLCKANGDIGDCYCSDVLPKKKGTQFLRFSNDLAPGVQHVRISLDTLTAMDINEASGETAIINDAGEAEIVEIDRTQFIRANYIVDLDNEITPTGQGIPDGMKVFGLVRKV